MGGKYLHDDQSAALRPAKSSACDTISTSMTARRWFDAVRCLA